MRSQAELDNISTLNLNSGRVKCPGFSLDGSKCPCAGYSASGLAQVLPDALFELLETAKERAMEQRVSEQVGRQCLIKSGVRTLRKPEVMPA